MALLVNLPELIKLFSPQGLEFDVILRVGLSFKTRDSPPLLFNLEVMREEMDSCLSLPYKRHQWEIE